MMLALETPIAHCQAIVAQLMARHDWQLLDATDYSQRLLARVQSEGAVDPATLTKAAVNLYCAAWHEACYSDGETRRRAYAELARYLYDRALHKYGNPETAHEITHEALILIYQQLDQCRSPGVFLAFVQFKLWHAATTYFRQHKRWVAHVAPLADGAEEEAGVELPDRQAVSPEAVALDTELSTALLTRIGELMQEAPRAHKQLSAVALKFLTGCSDQEIAQELETEVANVHVLRSRGLERLRRDPRLVQLAADFLAGSPPASQ